MIKRISSNLNIFTRENKRCYVYLPTPNNRPSLSSDRRTVTILNHCCCCFNGLWKVKAKYIVLCLNALAKLQNARGACHHSVLMGNWPTCSHMSWHYQSTKRFVISPFHAVWGAWDSVATRKVPRERKVTLNVCR